MVFATDDDAGTRYRSLAAGFALVAPAVSPVAVAAERRGVFVVAEWHARRVPRPDVIDRLQVNCRDVSHARM
jgi:hypothetical protein